MSENLELEKDSFESYQLFKEIIQKSKEKGKKEFDFKEGKIIRLGDYIIYQANNGQNEYFFECSKIIYLNNENINCKRRAFFIHDQASLDRALKITGIKNGILKNENNNLKKKDNYNSNNSSHSQDYESAIFSIKNIYIKEILKSSYNLIEESKLVEAKKILTEQRFNNRFKVNFIYSLDFNFKYLKEDYINNDIDYLDTANNWCIQIKKETYYNNTKSHCYIFGPKGTGKTTLLLKYINYKHIPRLYFSLKIMSKLGLYNKYSLLETIYIFDNQQQMENFAQTKIKDIPNSLNLMEFIRAYIEFIMNFYSENKIKKKEKIWVIIDDYNQDLYDCDCIIDKIIDYANNNKNKLFLCILGDGRYINEKLYKYYINKNNDFFGMYWNQSIENDISKTNKILKLPKYYYKYKDSKDISNDEKRVKENISEEFKKIKLESFLFLSIIIDLVIKLKDVKEELINLPLEYLTCNKTIDKDRNIIIKLSFNSEIYKTVFDERIRDLLKIESLKTKINLFKDEDKGKNGVEFEAIIVLQIWNNTFEYLVFPENNKLKVKNIYGLKYNKNDERPGLDLSRPIIIGQEIFGGKYYDLLLILGKDGKKYAIFIQIGLNKAGNIINIYLKNLIDNDKKYKDGIGTLIGHKIDGLGFLLIFEYEHQKALLKRNNKKEGVPFCINNNIDFLIYKDFNLYKEVNANQPIKSINVTKKTLIYEDKEENNECVINSKVCKNIAFQISDPIISLNEEEKKMISDFIANEFKIDCSQLNFTFTIIKEKGKGFKDFGIISSDNFNQINVFANRTNRYFSYKNKIFKISKGKIEKEKNYNEEEFNLDIYFLKKKRRQDLEN